MTVDYFKKKDLTRVVNPEVEPNLESGYYRHWKGGWYWVVGVAQNATTQAWEVVYQSVDSSRPYTRAYAEFIENVASGQPRFVRQRPPEEVVRQHWRTWGPRTGLRFTWEEED